MLILIWIATAMALLFSYRKDSERTLRSLKKSFESLKSLSGGLLEMIGLVGLIVAVIPEDQMVRLFTVHGMWGFALAALVGAIVTIPGPIAFPLVGALLQMGARPDVLASFITTLTMVGLATSSLESSYFGPRFTVMRQGMSFIAAIFIGLILGILL